MIDDKNKRNEVFIVSIKNHLLDEFSLAFIKNKVLSLSRGREFTAALVIDGLEQAKERENTPEEICFDGGIRRLPDYDVLKKYAYKHKSCIRERSTVPEELVIRNIYQLITDDMKCSLKEFVDSYNSWTWLHLKVKGMLHTVPQYDKDGENA